MLVSILLLGCALCLSSTAAYYSIAGLASIFAGSFWPVVIMSCTLEISKLVVTSWLYQNWKEIPRLIKWYLTTAVIILMFITSLGIFGFLTKAHVDQGISNAANQLQLEQIQKEISQSNDVVNRYQLQLNALDKAVNIQLDANKAQQAMNFRRQQDSERTQIKNKIDSEQQKLLDLEQRETALKQEQVILESKVGPIKYIAEFFAKDKIVDLDQAVRWMIVIIVIVFDPLAVLMVIAANMSLTKKSKNNDIAQNKLESGSSSTTIIDDQFVLDSNGNKKFVWNEKDLALIELLNTQKPEQEPTIYSKKYLQETIIETMNMWLTTVSTSEELDQSPKDSSETIDNTEENFAKVDNSAEDNNSIDIDDEISKGADNLNKSINYEEPALHIPAHRHSHITYGRK